MTKRDSCFTLAVSELRSEVRNEINIGLKKKSSIKKAVIIGLKINLLCSMLFSLCLKLRVQSCSFQRRLKHRWKDSSKKHVCITRLCDTQNTHRTTMEKYFNVGQKEILSKYVGVQKEHKQTVIWWVFKIFWLFGFLSMLIKKNLSLRIQRKVHQAGMCLLVVYSSTQLYLFVRYNSLLSLIA